MRKLQTYLLTASAFTALVAGLILTGPPSRREVVVQKIDDVRVVNSSSPC